MLVSFAEKLSVSQRFLIGGSTVNLNLCTPPCVQASRVHCGRRVLHASQVLCGWSEEKRNGNYRPEKGESSVNVVAPRVLVVHTAESMEVGGACRCGGWSISDDSG